VPCHLSVFRAGGSPASSIEQVGLILVGPDPCTAQRVQDAQARNLDAEPVIEDRIFNPKEP